MPFEGATEVAGIFPIYSGFYEAVEEVGIYSFLIRRFSDLSFYAVFLYCFIKGAGYLAVDYAWEGRGVVSKAVDEVVGVGCFKGFGGWICVDARFNLVYPFFCRSTNGTYCGEIAGRD